MQIFESILGQLKLFEKLYDIVRIVDPVHRDVLEIRGDKSFKTDIPCYKMWEKRQLCDNCISIRAFNENDTIYKLEHREGRIYMFTAIPIDFNGQKLIVECLKEIQNNLALGCGAQDQGAEFFNVLEYMNRAALKDPLTDLYNRRYMNERLPVDILNASVTGEPLSIILADIDNFKEINDTFGHGLGDRVLKEFAEELIKHIRGDGDWVARYGGEEFLICLNTTSLDSAKKVAEEIREGVAKRLFKGNGDIISLTCSLGVLMVSEEIKNMSMTEIIELADRNLYRAKTLGKNRVE